MAIVAVAMLLTACSASSTNPFPVYTIDKSGPDWILTFRTSGVIRVHLKCGHPGYITHWVGPEKPFHIHPGQWIEWTFHDRSGEAATTFPDFDHC